MPRSFPRPTRLCYSVYPLLPTAGLGFEEERRIIKRVYNELDEEEVALYTYSWISFDRELCVSTCEVLTSENNVPVFHVGIVVTARLPHGVVTDLAASTSAIAASSPYAASGSYLSTCTSHCIGFHA
ncbi:unnamed protein product [Fraxinus pennsylvanica]|uniref:Uncharacterized protein n=1 Tax=Fraxinus pennsylvanica TaxID=56036 RepID=A0AAD1ZWX2_9LAMI|nr:unnamed protein product [Fraxinus pennsylvanica]